jgi:hypothetical protein
LRRTDKEFAASMADALKEGADRLEDEALRRAKDGVDEPRFYQGEVCGYVRKYSDTLAILLLKARRSRKVPRSDQRTARRRRKSDCRFVARAGLTPLNAIAGEKPAYRQLSLRELKFGRRLWHVTDEDRARLSD